MDISISKNTDIVFPLVQGVTEITKDNTQERDITVMLGAYNLKEKKWRFIRQEISKSSPVPTPISVVLAKNINSLFKQLKPIVQELNL